MLCNLQNYENSPSVTTESSAAAAANPAPKTTSYPCKKCGVVFTGYYELVKHQKRVCMKNNIVPLPFGNQVSVWLALVLHLQNVLSFVKIISKMSTVRVQYRMYLYEAMSVYCKHDNFENNGSCKPICEY